MLDDDRKTNKPHTSHIHQGLVILSIQFPVNEMNF